ncbi:hypothetical protein ET33_00505 [Paenibacillus tyrfis]|uniref:Uncharacterized protein n=1 Tax=Paenibacillus tyrfis TaxID=1501230 RepID=A0A081PB55_9BACL|nr:hypothetical protein ET33_00505 [Paenibacillus tyrfis]
MANIQIKYTKSIYAEGIAYMLYLDALRSILPLYLFAANQENPLMLGEKIQWKIRPVLFLDKKYGFLQCACRGSI